MILVFKTKLKQIQEHFVKTVLSEFQEIEKIQIDFEDIDKVLRIVSKKDLTKDIIRKMKENRLYCDELLD